MRTTIILLLILIFSVTLNAKCSSSSIYITSTNFVLNKNGQIILEFYGDAQKYVSNLNSKYPVFLINGNEKTPLEIVDTFIGDFRLTQVILRPKINLKNGQKYTLKIEGINEKISVHNEKDKTQTEPIFTINNILDTIEPIIIEGPIFLKKTRVFYGCGPASNIYYALTTSDSSETFIKATLKELKDNKTTTYIFRIKDNTIILGHGMCSGAFYYKEKREYEIIFQAFDQSGNESKITKTYKFSSPDKETAEE